MTSRQWMCAAAVCLFALAIAVRTSAQDRPVNLHPSGATIITFEAPGSTSTYPASINTAGTIAGNYASSAGVGFHGFLRAVGGTFTEFDVAGSISTYVTSMNSGGAITGLYDDGTADHGFLRSAKGIITKFDPPASTYTYPTSINTGGEIAGSTTMRAILTGSCAPRMAPLPSSTLRAP